MNQLLSLPRRGAIALIDLYRLLLSPVIGPVCRFQPTCSMYAREAVMRFGLARGAWLAVRRIGRCHPWSQGGFDPVPEAATSEHHICAGHAHHP